MQTIAQIRRDGSTVVPNCLVANTFFSRFLGLMGKTSVPMGTGVLFPSCNSIHTLFMRIPIDVVFIDGSGCVVEVISAFRPWNLLLPRMKAKHTLELGAGQAAQLEIHPGTSLRCEGVF